MRCLAGLGSDRTQSSTAKSMISRLQVQMFHSETVLPDGRRVVFCIPKEIRINDRLLTEGEVLAALEAGRNGPLRHLASDVPYRLRATEQ